VTILYLANGQFLRTNNSVGDCVDKEINARYGIEASMTLWQLISAFLSGSLLTVILGWLKESFFLGRQREIAELQEKLKSLYGPLHFFVCQNQIYNQLAASVMAAYKTEFEDRHWSEESLKSLEGPTAKTIDLSNSYMAKVKDTNRTIKECLASNWHLIDLDDVDAFTLIQKDQVRMETELQDPVFKNLPFNIRRALGVVYFIRPEFEKRVTEKWLAKRSRLDRLTKWPAPWTRSQRM
jgi:hypothetical protein